MRSSTAVCISGWNSAERFLPERLGPVQGDVGVAQQLGAEWRWPPAMPMLAVTVSGTGVAVDTERLAQGVVEALGHHLRARSERRAFGQDDELVTPEPPHRVAARAACRRTGRHGLAAPCRRRHGPASR